MLNNLKSICSYCILHWSASQSRDVWITPALGENAATHWFQLPKTSICESVIFFESDAKAIYGFFPLAKHGAPRAIGNQH